MLMVEVSLLRSLAEEVHVNYTLLRFFEKILNLSQSSVNQNLNTQVYQKHQKTMVNLNLADILS